MSTTTGTELWRRGAGELAAAIRERQVSSREVVEAHLGRIEEVNPHVNAITRVLAEEALLAAADADRRLAAGEEVGPLHGVPVTIKENVDVAGHPTTQAVAAMAGAVPAVDAPHVAHLRAAGAIPLARTNLPDFALRWHTDNAVYGATRNPWEASRTAGGSSGGEGAALATGMTALGVGNDLGGSLRWPAQCNGICSLKPTQGRIPSASAIEPVDPPISIQLMAVQGPMARRVADLRLALEVMSRPSPRDPWHVPAPLAGDPPAAPVRVAVVTDPGGLGVSSQVAAGVRRAAEALSAAGYAVDEVEPPDVARAAETWLNLLCVDLRIMWQVMGPLVSDDANRFMGMLLSTSPVLDSPAYLQAFVARQAIARAWAEFQQEHPLIVAPIATDPPFVVGADLTEEGIRAIQASMRMVVAVNLLGVPAAAVPVGVADGLPQAVEVIGPRFREDLCLAAAGAIEEACGLLTPIDPR
ncbi:MAG TPA: amidase [Candidatus Dormibacteraeota bacterium]